jgi:hypothetical protein
MRKMMEEKINRQSQTKTPTTHDVTSHEEEEEHTENVFNFNERECTAINYH